MNRKTATLLGAASALAAGGSALAAPQPAPAVPVAASYAELLTPIPNASERLKLADAEAQQRPARLIEARYTTHHHHHHHSRQWYRQNGYVWLNGGWTLRPRHHHHHNHN
jgi:hypothetical protein